VIESLVWRESYHTYSDIDSRVSLPAAIPDASGSKREFPVYLRSKELDQMTEAIFDLGKRSFISLAVFVGTLTVASVGYGQNAIVFQAAGPNPGSIQSTVDQFRGAIGGINNGNTPGPIAAGRREINWDGGGSTATSLGVTPFDVFLNTRGNRSATPGTGFVQAPPSGLATLFGNPTYSTIFQAFSPSRLFSAIGSNITETTFFEPGSGDTKPALTRAFGVVFTDVDLPDGSGPGGKRGNRHASTLVEYFGADGELMFSSFVAASPGDAGLSFLGIVLPDARIARVRITAGGAIPGADDTDDVVMMDDFIYGEPKAIQLN